MSTVSDRIKFTRKQLNINQLDFATMLGLSQTHISKIESGRDNASDKVLRMICSEFNISFDWLKNGDGAMKQDNENGNGSNDAIVELKKFFATCSPIEADFCNRFLLQVPELFQLWSARPSGCELDIILQISDLLDNIVKLNKCLSEESKEIGASSNKKSKIEGIFWIRENYEKRIANNINAIFNLYLGSGA